MRIKAITAALLTGFICTAFVTDVPGEEAVAQELTNHEVVKEVEEVESTFWMPLGQFEITAYCIGTCCSSGTGITASGTVATVGRTIGVDPDLIPLGATVKIVFQDGTEHVFIAEDTGSAIKGNIIDLLLGSHEEALQFGRQSCRVYIEEVNDPRN